MMLHFYTELFAYNYDANNKLISALQQPETPEKALHLFSHIINAHQVWNNRILAKDEPYAVWLVHQPHLFEAINEANLTHTKQILATINLQQTLPYKNTQGASFENKVQDILFHVINHSTYHRAQIASLLKQTGITPPGTDYILYKR